MATIIFVHGAGCGPSHVQGFVQHICTEQHRIIVARLPGHGDGESPAGMTVQGYASYIRNLFPKDGDVILVGHSMGGLISLMAARNDSRVRSIILIGSVPPAGIFLRGEILLRMLHPENIRNIFGETFRFRETDLKKLFLTAFPKERMGKALSTFVPESGTALRDILLHRCRVPAREISCPVHVVAGEYDLLMPLSLQSALARKFNGTFRIIPEANHMMGEDPVVARTVALYIREYVEKDTRALRLSEVA